MDPTPSTPVARDGGRVFAHVLVNTAVAGLTTSFLWFGLVFWVYLETRSVLATGVIGGAYMLFVAAGSLLFGTIVDRHRKLHVMRISAAVTLTAFALAGAIYLWRPDSQLLDLSGPWFWVLTSIILAGAVVEHMRNIALSTLVTMLIPDEGRARANGLVGTVQGIAFIVTSVFAGIAIGRLGMGWTIVIAVALMGLTLLHLLTLRLPGDEVEHDPEGSGRGVDLRGAYRAVIAVSGLFALILFSTFNNLIGGVYMALLDPYGLELMSVEAWGVVYGIAATGFIVGGLVVARLGLGVRPMRTMLTLVAVMGVLGALFTVRESWLVFTIGVWLYMSLVPAVEAAEQTVIQRVVPFARQGRVFGFAMAFEAAAAPVTAFLIAPIAEYWIIPWSRTGSGRDTLAPVLGTGDARGIALVFFVAGLLMAAGAFLAMRSPQYRRISDSYATAAPLPDAGDAADVADDGTTSRMEDARGDD